jgi:hypothetical protein
MPSLPETANLAQVVSLFTPLVAGGVGLWRRMERKQTAFELQQQRIADKLDVITAQFGPNGGGLRQAVNEMSKKIDKIEERQIQIGDKVARLQGEFDQHMIEN